MDKTEFDQEGLDKFVDKVLAHKPRKRTRKQLKKRSENAKSAGPPRKDSPPESEVPPKE